MNPKGYFQQPRQTDQTPEEYFAEIRNAVQPQQEKGRQLTVEEERKKQDGFALDEMTKSAGWSIVKASLEAMPRQHVNPVGMSEQDWKFAELNAFYHGEVAKEILEFVENAIRESHTLQAIELGEIPEVQKMRI